MIRDKEWTDAQIANYYLGVRYSDYPRIFWDKMKPVMAGSASLVDIGSGPGAFALMAAEAGLRVQAVDLNRKNLEALAGQAGDAGLTNIQTIYGSWLSVAVGKSDVAVCAYSFGGEIGTRAGIRKIIGAARKAAFLIAPYDTVQTDFLSEALYERSGLPPPEFSGSYRDLLRLLADLGEEVSHETVTYDFGMPLGSWAEIGRCAVYLSEKLGLPSREPVREHLHKIITVRDGMLWVPNPRKSTMITWKRSDS